MVTVRRGHKKWWSYRTDAGLAIGKLPNQTGGAPGKRYFGSNTAFIYYFLTGRL